MTAIYIVVAIFALGAVSFVIAPFFVGRGGLLAAASSVSDQGQLEAMKKAIVRRYVAEEAASDRGDLSRREWRRRQSYLRHRYIDVTRRLDFLRRTQSGRALLVFLISVCAYFLTSDIAVAGVAIGKRHAIMLRGGIEQVVGHYFFTVENDSKVPQPFVTAVMLPADAIDVRPREGLTQEDVVAGHDGTIEVKKTFPPGVHLLSFDFVIGGKGGSVDVRMRVPYKVEELQLLTGKNSPLRLASNATIAPAMPGRDGIWVTSAPLEAGQDFLISVAGVTEGRQRLWVLGLSVAGVLFGVGGGLAWWSRPMKAGGKSDEEIMGT